MEKNGAYWGCIHCGCQIPAPCDTCPNCGKNPYEADEEELFDINPRLGRHLHRDSSGFVKKFTSPSIDPE